MVVAYEAHYRGSMREILLLSLAASAMPGCGRPDFDGLYRVESYAVIDGDCTGPATEIEREFSEFQIRETSFAGVTVYPLYPCDGAGHCDSDNHGTWNLVTTAEDSDQVVETLTYNLDDSCILSAVEVLIAKHPQPEQDGVVLERRISELAITPYVANECTTDHAKCVRDRMRCVEVLRVVGQPEPVIDM
jgi:hypothetical protein